MCFEVGGGGVGDVAEGADGAGEGVDCPAREAARPAL